MRQRVLTAALTIPLVVGVVVAQDQFPFLILISLVVAACANEFVGLFAPGDSVFGQVLGATLVCMLIVGCFSPAGALIVMCIAAVMCLRASVPPWAPAYLGLPLLALIYLHGGGFFFEWTWNWRSPVFIVLLPLWAGDTLALFVGKAIGKRPLAPAISPNKTVEGAIANLAGCIIVAGLLAAPLGFPVWKTVLCGAIIGVFGQAGDLFESHLKRKADRKDSGALLPGHGGLLDRLDSLLFAAVPVALVLFYL